MEYIVTLTGRDDHVEVYFLNSDIGSDRDKIKVKGEALRMWTEKYPKVGIRKVEIRDNSLGVI